MNNQQIIEEIEETEAKLASLRKRLSAPKTGAFVPEVGDKCYVPGFYNGWGSSAAGWRNKDGAIRAAFRDEESAIVFAQAMLVMVELRAQPGACGWGGDEKSYTIQAEFNNDEWIIVVYSFRAVALNTFSCCYESKEAAQAAIKAIGRDRIIESVKTLVGVRDE